MSLRVINIALVLTGVGLIAAIAVVKRQGEPAVAVRSDNTDVVLRHATHGAVSRMPALPEIVLPEGFSWNSIESRDYKQYIANLRAIECPEQTIRDIIVADINKLYEPREAPLRVQNLSAAGGRPSSKYGDLNDLQRMHQLREVQLEKRGLLKELLGIVIPLDPMRTINPRRYGDFEAAFAAVPEDKRAEVQVIQENYWYKSDYLNTQVTGPHDTKAAEEHKRRINEERRRELSKILTPAELEDYELRTSHAASYMRGQLRDFAPNEQEFREIFRIKAEYDIHFGGQHAAHNGPVEELNPGIRPEIEQRVREVLGEQRYQEYQRTLDPNYRALSQIAARYDLPADTAGTAYAIHQAYQQQIRQASSDPKQLADAKAQTHQALAQLLGERGAKAFQRMRK